MKISRINPSLRPVKIRSLAALLMGLLLLLSYSCKKEEALYPYAELVRFEVKDATGNTLQAAIHDNDIVIYWPPDQAVPESISPQLNVSEKASISPASGTKVPFADGTKYTVTAEDGTVKVYTLKRVLNQPKPYLKDEGRDFNLKTMNGKFVIVASEELSFYGDYFNPADGQLKVFLQTANGKEVEAPIDTAAFHRNVVRFNAIPGDDAVGQYVGIRIASAPYSISVKKDFEVLADPRPKHNLMTANSTAKIGGELTFVGKNMDKTTAIRIWNNVLNGYYDVEIIAKQADQLKVKIPETGFPEGTYTAAFYNYDPIPNYPSSINSLLGIYRPFGATIKITK